MVKVPVPLLVAYTGQPKLRTSDRPLYQHSTASLAGCDAIARAARICFQIAECLRAATSEKQDESRPAAIRANPLPRIHHSATTPQPPGNRTDAPGPNPLPRIHHSATPLPPRGRAQVRKSPNPLPRIHHSATYLGEGPSTQPGRVPIPYRGFITPPPGPQRRCS